jgi:hypothetical protein
MSKTYGPPTPADEVARLLRRRGVGLDPMRLEESVAAQRSREKADFVEYRDRIEMLASAVRRARRVVELEEWAWRQRPTQNTLQAAKAAQQARKAAEDELLEACSHDRDLYRAVLRRA